MLMLGAFPHSFVTFETSVVFATYDPLDNRTPSCYSYIL